MARRNVELLIVALGCGAAGVLLGHLVWPPAAEREARVRRDVARLELAPSQPAPAADGPHVGPTPNAEDEQPVPAAEVTTRDRYGVASDLEPDPTRSEGQLVDGKRQGAWRDYYKNGYLASEVTYRDHLPHGEGLYYHPNGALWQRGSWVQGKREGLWQHFDADGNLLREEEWQGGALAAPIRLFDPKGEFPRETDALQKASVNGKYATLIRKIAAPDDAKSYGKFRDWGKWSGTGYLGHRDFEAGHWVYVWPYWYVWRDIVNE